jgi:hypothetical protein
LSPDQKTDSVDYAAERAGVDKAELHKEMLTRFKECRDYWRPQYDEAKADVKFAFVPDSQWDEWMSETRKGRPCYTVNKVRQAMKQITNDQRQNRPQAKVRAVEGADQKLAEVRQGIIRGIDSQLDAQRAVDTAFQFAVGGGYGVWRITTSYQDDGGFDQVIQREEIPNPYSVFFDHAAKKKDRRDARYAFVEASFARSAFRARWPDAKLVSVDDTTDATREWFGESDVIVAEYYYKKVERKEIVLMSDGAVYDAEDIAPVIDDMAAAGVTEQRRRWTDRDCVYHCIVSGAEIIEGPKKVPGRFIPLVPVWGELIRIDDKDVFFGAVRFAKDAQRMYNYERSTFIEVIADQPYSPFMAEASSVEGYESQYQNMRVKRPPVLFYNANPQSPNGGRPTREAPPDFPVALANAAQISSDDIKSATGIYDASLGAKSNETSGRAIIARQREGDVANFDYIDNLSYALRYDFEITSDLITEIYDTARQVRIIGEDGKEDVAEVNKQMIDQQTGQPVTLNDLSQGRYDVSVTVGPSYTTQRMEAAEALQQLANDPSPLGMVAKYGFIMNLDSVGLEEVKKAARMILVGQGLLERGEDDPPPGPPPPPDPKVMADAKKADAQATLYAEQAQGQDLQNQETAIRLGIEMGQAGMAPQPPQGTAPGGFPGAPTGLA